MPTRGGRRSGVARSQRRRTSWVTVDQTISIPAANGYNTIDLLASFKADGGTQQAVTIGRTHLRIAPTAGFQAPGNSWYLGLIRGQNSDVGASVVGAPNPATALYADWLLWEHVVVDTGLGINQYNGEQLMIDSKAMRRLEELQMNYNLVITVPASSVFPATFLVTGRVLLLLP